MFGIFSDIFGNENFIRVFKMVYYTSFIWLPVFSVILLVELWVMYVRALYMSKQNYVLLEIKVPKDVHKSPRAAEFFISSVGESLRRVVRVGRRAGVFRFPERLAGRLRSGLDLPKRLHTRPLRCCSGAAA